MPGQKRVAEFIAGQVSTAIWENDISAENGKQGAVLTAAVQGRYEDRDRNCKSNGSFRLCL